MRTAGGPIHYLVGPLWLSAPPAPSLDPSPTNYVLSQSSHAFVIKRTREEHQTVQNRRTNLNVRNRTTPAMRDMVVLKPRHLGNVSDGTRRRSDFKTAPNNRRDNRDKRREKR